MTTGDRLRPVSRSVGLPESSPEETLVEGWLKTGEAYPGSPRLMVVAQIEDGIVGKLMSTTLRLSRVWKQVPEIATFR